MKQLLFRLTAYLMAGLSVGFSVRFVVFDSVTGWRLPVITVMALGGIGVIIAVWLLVRASSGVSNGIRINPPWTVAAMDAVCMIASAMAVFFIVDGYGEQYFGFVQGLANPLLADVIVVMFLPSALILALFVTTSGGQNIDINRAGVMVSGPFGTESVSWDKIVTLEPDEQYVVVSRLGFPIPRRLRTNLEVVTSEDETLTIYQPGLKSTASIILERVNEHAPARLSQDINEIEGRWL